MATDQAAQHELPADMEPLDLLAFKLRRTQKLLLIMGAGSLLALLLAIALLTLTLLTGSRVSQAEYRLDELATQLALQLSSAQEQYALSEQSTLQLRSALAETTARLSQLDVNDPANVIIKVQRILIRQERDYRDFLLDLERGMHDIQMMIPHSRGWWDSYSEQIKESISLSEARENYLLTLREN